MWTTENRARYDRSKLRYPSDLTDAEWALIAPVIPRAKEPRKNKRFGLRFAPIEDSGSGSRCLRFADDRRNRDPRAVCGHQGPIG